MEVGGSARRVALILVDDAERRHGADLTSPIVFGVDVARLMTPW